MSQYEILELLKRNKGQKFTNQDIADILGTTKSSATLKFQKLRKSGLVKWKKERDGFPYRYYHWV